MDIEKAKSDIVYFAEQFLDIKLQSWQKDLLRAFQRGDRFVFMAGCRYGKRMLYDLTMGWLKFKEEGGSVMKYRKKPVVIEALQYTGYNDDEIIKFTKGMAQKGVGKSLIIPTLEGDHIASVGDYIIKGIKGEFYPCKPDIFEKTYEKVEG